MSNLNKTSPKPYIIGFVLSLILTLSAYLLILNHVNSGHLSYSHDSLILMVMGLAVAQFIVQAMFFLHVGKEPKPRWNLMVFLFTVMVVLIIVLGSLWIMANLNRYHIHRLPPEEIKNYLIEDEGFER